MSDNVNIELLDRAAELLEEIASHPSGYDKKLSEAVKSGDLNEVRFWVTKIESGLSQEHFHNHDLLGENDAY